jgi:hypothetical protein
LYMEAEIRLFLNEVAAEVKLMENQ